METFNLPKAGGGFYQVTGKPLTPVYRDAGRGVLANLYGACVIQLASGEKLLYVKERLRPHSNRYDRVCEMYRNAQNMSAADVSAAVGSPYNNGGLFDALGTDLIEVIA